MKHKLTPKQVLTVRAINCEHDHIIRGNDYGSDIAWCDDCGKITFHSDEDWPDPTYRTFSDLEKWHKERVIAFGCKREADGEKLCAHWCNHDYCPAYLKQRMTP